MTDKITELKRKNPHHVMVSVTPQGVVLKQKQLIVPKHLSVAKLLDQLRKYSDVKPETAIYLIDKNGMMMTGNTLFGDLDEPEGGVVKLTLVKENVFG